MFILVIHSFNIMYIKTTSTIGKNGNQALLGTTRVPVVTRRVRWLLPCRLANSLRSGLTDRPPSPFGNNRALDCRSVTVEPMPVPMGTWMTRWPTLSHLKQIWGSAWDR